VNKEKPMPEDKTPAVDTDPLDSSRKPAGPGSDAWTIDPAHPADPRARKIEPAGAPGAAGGTANPDGAAALAMGSND
jgi:hypothetical protein